MSEEIEMTVEPEQADAVALLTAHLAGDEQAIETLLDLLGPVPLFAVTVGFLVDQVIGPDRLADVLDDWRAHR